MSRDILTSMFHSFVLSYLRYGILIWGNTFASYLHHINMLYNKAIRAVLNEPTTAHILPLMSRLNVLAFADLYIYNCCVFMYEVYHNIPPEIICKMFTKLSSLRSLTRYNLHDFYLLQVRLDICKRCISFNGVQH